MYRASRYHCMGPCGFWLTFSTRSEVTPMDKAARNTPVKCQRIHIESAMRMNAAGRPGRRGEELPSRVGAAGLGLAAGGSGVGAEDVFRGAPTMCYTPSESPKTAYL